MKTKILIGLLIIGVILISNLGFAQTLKEPIIEKNKTPVEPSEPSFQRVSAKILDKYTQNVTLRTPNKTACREFYDNYTKLQECLQNNFEDSAKLLNFVKIEVDSSILECIPQTQHDFDEVEIGKVYDAEISTIRQYTTSPRFIELGDEYCSFILYEEPKLFGEPTKQLPDIMPKAEEETLITFLLTYPERALVIVGIGLVIIVGIILIIRRFRKTKK